MIFLVNGGSFVGALFVGRLFLTFIVADDPLPFIRSWRVSFYFLLSIGHVRTTRTAAQLRRQWGLLPKANLRDHLTTPQLDTIIQIEGAITLQLESRSITNPADQLRVVRHVALGYRNLIEGPLPTTQPPSNAHAGLNYAKPASPAGFFMCSPLIKLETPK